MSEIQDLVNQRKEAIERGDKVAGRDIYHRLQVLGVSPADIDADTVPTDEEAQAAPTEPAAVEPAPPVENAQAADLPERT